MKNKPVIEQVKSLVEETYNIKVVDVNRVITDADLRVFVKYIRISNVDAEKYDIRAIHDWLIS